MSGAQKLAAHLSKSELITMLDIMDAARSVGTEQQFHQLMHMSSRLVPIERAYVSVADLDAEGRIVRSSHHVNLDFPLRWLDTYREQAYFRIDPVAQLLFKADRPLIWAELHRTHRSRSDRTFYGCAADFGLRNGFSFGARFARSPSASFFSCVGHEITHHPRHVATVQYLVPHLHAALSKVHLGMLKESPGLTAREIEVLNWAKFGKTNWEVSLQINISERAVKFHIENAMRKLHACNRSQAVAIALSQGLIEWG